MVSIDAMMARADIPERLIRHATLRQMQVFESIVRLGSFTRAAEELYLSQSTVSMQIKKLSETLGLPLFEQVGRQIYPTEAGHELYEACRRTFLALADLETNLADLKGLRRGHLRLATITTAKYVAPRLLGHFCRRYPEIEVSLKVTNRDRVTERLLNNQDDLYILGHEPEEELAVEAIRFLPNPLIVVAPRRHPLADRKHLAFAEVAEEPFILRESGSGIRDATLDLFKQHGLRPRVRMELGSNEAIKHAVVGELGLAVLSLHSLLLDGGDQEVAILDVEGFPIQHCWYIVYPRAKQLSVVASTFRDFVLEEGSRYLPGPDGLGGRTGGFQAESEPLPDPEAIDPREPPVPS